VLGSNPEHHKCCVNALPLSYTLSLETTFKVILQFDNHTCYFIGEGVLEFELRAWCFLGRCSTTGAMPPALFIFIILE
jgi:hypothetical protein